MPDPLVVMVGDLHAGSSTAVMEPFTDHDDIRYSPSRVQSVLLNYWKRTLEQVKAAAKGHDVILCLGGDLVDGVFHHGSLQTLGDAADQRDLAVQLLLPYATMAKAIFGLAGTGAHSGQGGMEDRSVVKELGGKTEYRWRLEISGRLLDWSHHAGMGRRPWTEETALTGLGNKTRIESLDRGQRVPDIIVRHHVHKFVRAHVKGIDIVTCPGWQAQTAYTRQLDPAGLLAVGVVLYFPVTGEIRPLITDWPDDKIHKVTFQS